jgi:hypothetical protein
MGSVISLEYMAKNELDFYPLSPSFDVRAQPAFVRDQLEEKFADYVIIERLVTRKWRGGGNYAYQIMYILMQQETMARPKEKPRQSMSTSADEMYEYGSW